MTPEEITTYRKSIAMVEYEFAHFLNVTKQAVIFWETGQRRIPPTTVEFIAMLKKFPQLVDIQKTRRGMT